MQNVYFVKPDGTSEGMTPVRAADEAKDLQTAPQWHGLPFSVQVILENLA